MSDLQDLTSPEDQLLTEPAEPEKITALPSKKVKNPKRVAAGKALAARNKEKLAKIKAFEDQTVDLPEPSYNQNKKDNLEQCYWFIGGLLITLGFGYTIARLTCQPKPSSNQQPPSQPSAQKITENDFF